MPLCKAYAAITPKSSLLPFEFERRVLRPHDVLIDILYCGVCHSDIHWVQDDFGASRFPMVPGHEIVGRVVQTGSAVQKFRVGDFAGVGCLVDACRNCNSCKNNLEQYCEKGFSLTYNGYEQDGKTPTQGGYADNIVVDEKFTLRIPAHMDLARTAPLLCAGITTYSPLKYWKVGKDQKVGIIGLGGLGHMGLKFAHTFGAHTALITTSPNKILDGKRLGANEVIVSTDAKQMSDHEQTFDLLLNTATGRYDLNAYLRLLKRDGVMAVVGVTNPKDLPTLNLFDLIMPRRQLAGSIIGGLTETQEMLGYCAQNHIYADIELIPIQEVNEAYLRVLKGDVKYRFVIDMQSLGKNPV